MCVMVHQINAASLVHIPSRLQAFQCDLRTQALQDELQTKVIVSFLLKAHQLHI